MTDRDRWPHWVYGEGQEPDYRFSFANERTYLAWIRTSLALFAAGVALDVVDLSIEPDAQRWLAMGLVVLGMVSAIVAWFRWAKAERAMRNSRPLPTFGFGAFLTLAVVAAALTWVLVGW